MMTAAISAIVNAMLINEPESAIELADRVQSRSFWTYVVVLIVAALATAFFTVKLWQNTGKYQDAVRLDANARIEEAKRGAEEAHSQAADALRDAGIANQAAGEANREAARANEHANTLEQKNIQLRTDLETATAESRAKQAELATEQTKLSAEQRKTAEAQREAAVAQLALKKYLDEVAERQKPWHLTVQQEADFVAFLRIHLTGPVNIICGNAEACGLAKQIAAALRKAGWTDVRGGDGEVMSVLVPFVGIRLVQLNRGDGMPAANSLVGAFTLIHFPVEPLYDTTHSMAEGVVDLIIGIKP